MPTSPSSTPPASHTQTVRLRFPGAGLIGWFLGIGRLRSRLSGKNTTTIPDHLRTDLGLPPVPTEGAHKLLNVGFYDVRRLR